MMVEQLQFSFDNLTLAAQRFGDPNGPPLLALHGWLDNSASFLPLAPYLADYNIVAIDLPGHGHSDHLSADNPYHFIDAILHVDNIVQALGWQQYRVLGHSMGGGIATLLAGTLPHQISHIAVIEGLGPLTETVESTPAQVSEYLQKYRKIKQKRRNYYPSVQAAAAMRAKAGYISEQHALILAERGTKASTEGFSWRHDPKLYLPSPIRLTEEQVLSFIKRIQAPLCFIIGSHGFRYDDSKMAARRTAVAQLTDVTCVGGHHVHMENPEQVAAKLQQFWGK